MAEERYDLSWVRGRLRDDYFLHRVSGHAVDTSGQEMYERAQWLGHRWWTVDELAATTETVFPFGLAGLVTGLIPPHPVQLSWHH